MSENTPDKIIAVCTARPDATVPAFIHPHKDEFLVTLRVEARKELSEARTDDTTGFKYSLRRTTLFHDGVRGDVGHLVIRRFGAKHPDKDWRGRIKFTHQIGPFPADGFRTYDGYLLFSAQSDLEPIFERLEENLRAVLTDRNTGKLNATGRAVLKALSNNDRRNSKGQDRLRTTAEADFGPVEQNVWRESNRS